MTDKPIAYTKEGRPLYDNTPTVVVVRLEHKDSVLCIRRATEPGLGKWALPGGYHMRGESWEQCGAREVLEEVGVELQYPNALELEKLVTDEYGNNLLMSSYYFDEVPPVWPNLEEVQEAQWFDYDQLPRKEEWAFPLHYQFTRGVW